MNKKIFILTVLSVLFLYISASAAEYRFTYKNGKVEAKKNIITSGKDSGFAVSYGAASEVRCGPGSTLVVNETGNTRGAVFTLKEGTCFIRLIDDGSSASVTLNTPFAVIKSFGAAFYSGCREKDISVYDGSVRVKYANHLLKLTAGKTFMASKITENTANAGSWKEWNFKRDKNDLFIEMRVDKVKEAKLNVLMNQVLLKGYGIGSVFFEDTAEPQDLTASITVTARQQELKASGIIFSKIAGPVALIDASQKAEKAGDPFESQALLPLVYDISASILKGVDQAEAKAMKNSRKVIIEADGLSDTGCAMVEKLVSGMPGFISVNQKKYHNIKAVFEVMLYGTGCDIAECIIPKIEKSNINVWKYSKNIVKLRAVKVEK